MNRKFKVGDKVTPIQPSEGFIPGVIYTLFEVYNYSNHQWVRVKEDSNGEENGRSSEFFKLIEIAEEKSAFSIKKLLTLPTDSEARKDVPVFSGCVKYFPAALAGVSKISKAGNDKHNPGQELHHDRTKSLDHKDCILRHLMDTEDLIAALERGQIESTEQILAEVNALAWRALAYSQSLHEKYAGAPLAPGAKLKDTK